MTFNIGMYYGALIWFSLSAIPLSSAAGQNMSLWFIFLMFPMCGIIHTFREGIRAMVSRGY